MRLLIQLILRIWASPYSLLGLVIGFLGLATGTKLQLVRGVLEFHGGFVTWLLKKTPVNAVAMTLGHTILGQSADYLQAARNHEHVHVKQYERWGPFFVPAYLLSSLYLWVIKRDPYRDNPFEVEAYAKESIDFTNNDHDPSSL